MAAALAPHLQAHLARSAAPVRLPETDTSEIALRDGGDDGHQPGVNHKIRLSKKCLSTALRATAGLVETCSTKEEPAGGVQTAELLAGFFVAIEVSSCDDEFAHERYARRFLGIISLLKCSSVP